MSDFDPQQFESELRRLRPGKPPQETLQRILKKVPARAARPWLPSMPEMGGRWARLLRLLIPAGAVTVLLTTWVFQRGHPSTKPTAPQRVAVHSPVKADKVEIDRQLVADFDAVGKLPNGEPVRFRCQQWMEKVKLREIGRASCRERV